MTVKKIYFDMDGVLADFDNGLVELCHIPPVDQEHQTPQMSNMIFDNVKKVDHFYDRLGILPGAKELFFTVWEKYGDRCEVLTGVPKPWRGIVTAGDDKISWMHRHFTEDVVVNIVLREEKKNFCLGPEYVLIDDYTKNLAAWESLGGTGIHHTDAASTLAKLKEMEII